MELYDYLQAYAKSGKIPMHMPGHKRNSSFSMANPYEWDVTEVEGLDNLHHPRGILKQEMERLGRRYHTRDTYFLVNGSTGGILTAIASCCRRGDKILVARNCHRSVYHAIYLLNLMPVYIYPEVDEETGIALDIPPQQIADMLEQENVSCVILTSPTYEGIVSDIKSIAAICHRQNIPLIVDEAHGAHLAWGKMFPETAIQQGADLVIESLHKTLPALTQTALLHRVTERVKAETVARYLSIFQTSSPSYVLMASMSQCVSWLEQSGDGIWTAYDKRLSEFERQAADWRHLWLWRRENQDRGKLVIGTWGAEITGIQLAERLRNKYLIEVEMETPSYILAMTSVADREETLPRFADALTQIDAAISERTGSGVAALPNRVSGVSGVPAVVRLCPYEAAQYRKKRLRLEECQGEIAAEYAYVYPPGIPFLAAGEQITAEVAEQIRQAGEAGLPLLGMEDETGSHIYICDLQSEKPSDNDNKEKE